ncbi:Protein MAIN-LIKE 1 [Glycine soja]
MVIMVRTRGLGRALARVIGRGRQDEHDAVDVTWRRRPTASAHRQRVHIAVDEGVSQVTEDVPHMAEDVLQMTEDVPHMADDVPQMSEDAPQMTADVDATVVEDLGCDGVEGHVAHAIWIGQERPELKLVSHGRKVAFVALIGTPVPEIEGLVPTTGLSPLIGCLVVTGDPGLISTFVERWHRETNTFHLPVGELTITLDDVSSLLHLPISGAFHSYEALSVDETIFLLMELLEVSGEEARAEIIYETRCQTRRWIVAARAYLLHLVGCTIFSNKSATNIHVVHLEAFRDLGQSGGYAWGATALVHMYDQLDEASRTMTRQIGGYLTLLQEHFPSVHQCVIDDAYEETSPRASRWLTTKAYMKGIAGVPYWACCDALIVTNVSTGEGAIQSIPPPPVSASLSYDDIDDRWMHFSDHVAAVGDFCIVPGQVSADYMEWFFQISHPFIIPTQAGYETIVERLGCVLNLRMVTAGIKLHDIMQDCSGSPWGVPAQMEVLGLDKDGAQSIDDVFYVL